jgi:hypothetical protein
LGDEQFRTFGNYAERNKRLMLVSCRIGAVARMGTGGSLSHSATSLVNPGAKTGSGAACYQNGDTLKATELRRRRSALQDDPRRSLQDDPHSTVACTQSH